MEPLEPRLCLAAGALGWGFQLDHHSVSGVAADAAGNVYMVGTLEGTVDFAPSPTRAVTLAEVPGFDACYVVKYSPKGALLWTRWVGTERMADGVGLDAVAVDRKTGDLLLGGSFDGQVDLGKRAPGAAPTAFALTSTSRDGLFLRMNSATGLTKFAAKLNGRTGDDFVTDIDSDAAGNVYMSGAFTHYPWTYPEEPTIDISDAFVVKFDSTNRWAWTRRYGNDTDPVKFGQLAVDRAGNVYVEGTNLGTTDYDPSSTLSSRTIVGEKEFVLKLNTNGGFGWLGRLDGATGEGRPQVRGLATDASGNVVVVGDFMGTVDLNFSPRRRHNLVSHAAFADAFVAKYNGLGEIQWARQIGNDPASADFASHDDYWGGASDGERAVGVVTDSVGNVYVSGRLSKNTWFGANATGFKLTESGMTAQDRFVAKYSPAGTLLKAVMMAGTSWDHEEYYMAVDGVGNLFLAGTFDYRLDIDPGTRELNLVSRELDEFANRNVFLVKLV
jgi:hypothetical protein